MGGSKKGKDERVAAPPSHMTVMQVTECDKGLLIFEGLLGHEKVRIMIDSGATGCFVHEALARRLKLPLKKKLSPDRVEPTRIR
jgi:predicted aspartyl protease